MKQKINSFQMSFLLKIIIFGVFVCAMSIGFLSGMIYSSNRPILHSEETIQLWRRAIPLVAYNCTEPPVDNEVTLESLGIFIDHPVRDTFKKSIVRYIDLHKRILAGELPPRYVVWKGGGKLCNQMRGIAAAFTFALLTDRAFLVPKFGVSKRKLLNLFKSPGFDISASLPKRSQVIEMDMSQEMNSTEWYACTNLSALTVPVIRLMGANYINTFLYVNPYLQEKMRELFLDDDLYRPIVHYLFRPLDKIIKLKNDFVSKQLSGKSHRVGFHFRNEYPINEIEWKAYKECAIAVTPDIYTKNSHWFVATDRLVPLEVIQQNLNQSITFYSPDSVTSLEHALLDILIAADVDALFLTPHSSYSRMISVFAKTPHVYMVTDHGIPEQDPHATLTKIQDYCYRYLSKEECAWWAYDRPGQAELARVSCYHPGMKSDYCF
jgi:hypothetical protein